MGILSGCLAVAHHEGFHTRRGDALPQGGVLVEPPTLAGLLVLFLASGERHYRVEEGQIAPFFFRTIHHYGKENQNTTMGRSGC